MSVDPLEHRGGDALPLDYPAVCLDHDTVDVAFRRKRKGQVQSHLDHIVTEGKLTELGEFRPNVMFQVVVEGAFHSARLEDLRVLREKAGGIGHGEFLQSFLVSGHDLLDGGDILGRGGFAFVGGKAGQQGNEGKETREEESVGLFMVGGEFSWFSF